MKLLVIGLDGVDRRLVEHFDMPFTRSLLDQLAVLPVKEDLWSRGWVKMLSGLPPTTTGAYYEQPALNGKPAFTQSYGSKSYPTNAVRKPLWAEVDALGKRAAWLNLPTMMPAPALNGVVLGGAGGGFSPENRIPRAACHPPELQDLFISERMVWENRYIVSGIRHTDLFFSKCTEALWSRARIYADLVRNRGQMDLGFFVQKEPVVISNIYMYSIEQLMEEKHPRLAVHYLLNQFYSALDDTLKYVFDRLQPEQVMVVSDHGAAPYRKSMNFNVMLQDLGFLKYTAEKTVAKGKGGPVDKLKARFAHEVRQVTNSHPRADFPSFTPIDFGHTKAFTNFYVPGIFLYDQRFGGQALEAVQAQALTDAIVRDFNAHPEAKENKLVARPFRREHAGTPAYDLLPEVWVDHPVDLFPEQRGLAVQKNPYYRDWSDLAGLPRDIGSGKKSPDALCVVDPRFLRDVDPARQGLDLTVVHELVLNHFRS
ncbi:MAG: alkaline phosphatase family protein [Flavobacteriales bacterium]|nr:alkaline phosphatase family protein [Flavobacteriales bacterium]